MDNAENSPAIELRYWVFKIIEGPKFMVCVQGYREESGGDGERLDCWQSSPIADIEDAKTLISVSGSRYRLLGRIDQDQALINRYSSGVIKAFRDGFPPEWKALLMKEHKKMMSSEELNESILESAPTLSNSFLDSTLSSVTSDKGVQQHAHRAATTTARVKTATQQSRPTKAIKMEPGIAADDMETAKTGKAAKQKQPGPPSKAVLQEAKVELMAGKRLSYSGRLIKPRLQTWAGERISYDMNGNPIGVHSVITKAIDGSDSSEKMTAICEELGVDKLEPSKQVSRSTTLPTQRASLKRKRTRKSDIPKRRKSTGGGKLRRHQLVDYSSSSTDSDSFLAAIDRISLTPSPPPSTEGMEDSPHLDPLTPIPLTWKRMNPRAIASPATVVRPKKREETVKKHKSMKPQALPRRKSPPQKGHSKAKKHVPKKIRTVGGNRKARRVSSASSFSSSTAASSSEEEEDSESDSEVFGSTMPVMQQLRRQAEKANRRKTARAPRENQKEQRTKGKKPGYKSSAKRPSSSPAPANSQNSTPAPSSSLPMKKAKNKRWTAEEVKRLRVALKAAQNPSSAGDWEMIARSVAVNNNAGQRSGDECKKHAIEVLRWKAPTEQDYEGEKHQRVAGSNSPEVNIPAPSSGYRRAQPKSLGGADYFAGMSAKGGEKGRREGAKENVNLPTLRSTKAVPTFDEFSSLELDPNDSLLTALRSPEEKVRNLRKPFIPKVLNTTGIADGYNRRNSTASSSQLATDLSSINDGIFEHL